MSKWIEPRPIERPQVSGGSRALAGIGGISLIAFFACTEILPFTAHFHGVAKNATAHLVVVMFGSNWHNASTLLFLIPAMVFLVLACLPFRDRGFQPLCALLCLVGMLFFPLSEILPNPTHIGFLWGLFGFTWIGANLWVWERDYLFASLVGLFLWDLSAGAQGLAYHMKALAEPYGNAIHPQTIVIIDCTAICIVVIAWFLGLDFEKLWYRFVLPRFSKANKANKANNASD